MRAALKAELLKAMAFISASRPTSSTTKAWRVGTSKALIRPSIAARPSTQPTVMCPVKVSRLSVSACSAASDWVTIKTRRLLRRSAKTPPSMLRTVTGVNWKAQTSPTASGESLSWSTSQDCAVDCIHVPTRLTSCPNQNRRKLRNWKAARPSRKPARLGWITRRPVRCRRSAGRSVRRPARPC